MEIKLSHALAGKTIKDGNLVENIYNLFDEGAVDSINEYRSLMIELLSLLSDPNVSSKLERAEQKIAGKRLVALAHFFETLEFEGFFNVLSAYEQDQYPEIYENKQGEMLATN